ncbi:MAG: hypothetical protein EXX96DRAFT_18561 [Benjaminiella poitrasii]|nr:MAG: hypothetical protein EXX96DRAFT_18561 [Benjaminiella poitrasii]
MRHALGHTKDSTVRVALVGDLGTFHNRVEGLELEFLNALASQLGVGQGVDDTEIDGVLVLGTRGVGRQEDDIVTGNIRVALDGRLIDNELVQSKSTRLIGTQDGDGSHFLNSGDTSDDGLMLSELFGTDGERDGEDGRHGDGDTTDEQDEDVIDTCSVLVVELGVHDEDFKDDEQRDSAETKVTDLGQDGLQVTDVVTSVTDQFSSTTKESVGTGTDHDSLRLTLFDSRTRKDLITSLFTDRQRFTRESSLINRDLTMGCDQTTVSGDDVTQLDRDDITRHQFSGLKRLPFTITSHFTFGGKRSHESLDGVTSLALF